MPHRPANRHVTSTVLALVVATPGAVLQGSAPAAAAPSPGPTATLTSQRPGPATVRGWSVALDRRAAGRQGQRVLGRQSFETVGVTWTGGGDPHVEVRTLGRGGWSAWQDAAPLVGGRKGATEPIWVGTSRAVRVRVDEWRRDLSVVMVDPGEEPAADGQAATSTAFRAPALSTATVTAAKRGWHRAPRPRLRKRRDWGANEKLRDGAPVYVSKIKQAHVHHTAGASSYTRADVPGIIRGMYWYHTKQLGWSDLGYNFLVDRFGRIWEGRAGGYTRRVRGAHTLGFNHASFGVAVIGNMEKLAANEKMKGALVRLIAWKLDKDRRQPARKVTIYSKGSDLYPKGTKVRLPTIDGHRDTNQTACPGRRLYRILPEIRRRAQARVDRWN